MQVLRDKNTGNMGIKQKNFFALFILYFFLFTIFSGCSSHSEEVRKPAVSGSFYPSDKKSLKRMVDDFLAGAEPEKQLNEKQIFGLIVPHAGYIYSGGVAGYSYKSLIGRKIKTVILIGPSHYVPFDGVSVYPGGFWETPLGRVPVNENIASLLMKKCGFVKPFLSAHEREHSLEVQVPFLQEVLEDFKIVPLVVGNLAPENFEFLSDAIAEVINGDTSFLIIASSDMSHYHSYAKACLMDGMALRHISALKIEDLKQDLGRGLCELCGAGPVLTILEIAEKLNAKAKVLKYANSGDVTGDKDRVVGYCAVAFYVEARSEKNISPARKGGIMLNKEQQKKLLDIARKTLEEYIRNKKIPEFKETDPQLTEKSGAFVTLTEKGQLRGCIGHIQPILPLFETISRMAVESSTGDPRFPAVSPEELKDIHIEISVLTPLEQIDDANKVEVGKHGLYIKKGYFSGLLLPQVATSYGWNKWQFLDQTCSKAGLSPGSWKDKDCQIFVFSAQVFGE